MRTRLVSAHFAGIEEQARSKVIRPNMKNGRAKIFGEAKSDGFLEVMKRSSNFLAFKIYTFRSANLLKILNGYRRETALGFYGLGLDED